LQALHVHWLSGARSALGVAMWILSALPDKEKGGGNYITSGPENDGKTNFFVYQFFNCILHKIIFFFESGN